MEPKDVSCLSSSGFKSWWKAPRAVCIQHKTMAREHCGAMHRAQTSSGAQPFFMSSRLLFSWQCLINNQCCLVLVGFRSSGMHWIIWAVWVQCGFFHPLRWLYFILSTEQRGTLGCCFCLLLVALWSCLRANGLELTTIVELGECQGAFEK